SDTKFFHSVSPTYLHWICVPSLLNSTSLPSFPSSLLITPRFIDVSSVNVTINSPCSLISNVLIPTPATTSNPCSPGCPTAPSFPTTTPTFKNEPSDSSNTSSFLLFISASTTLTAKSLSHAVTKNNREINRKKNNNLNVFFIHRKINKLSYWRLVNS